MARKPKDRKKGADIPASHIQVEAKPVEHGTWFRTACGKTSDEIKDERTLYYPVGTSVRVSCPGCLEWLMRTEAGEGQTRPRSVETVVAGDLMVNSPAGPLAVGKATSPKPRSKRTARVRGREPAPVPTAAQRKFDEALERAGPSKKRPVQHDLGLKPLKLAKIRSEMKTVMVLTAEQHVVRLTEETWAGIKETDDAGERREKAQALVLRRMKPADPATPVDVRAEAMEDDYRRLVATVLNGG